uniref:Uncharacterized protein n=1 Tax=Populus trichocarpa TaxID=3694 RepID=A0A3N7EY00_POPTR
MGMSKGRMLVRRMTMGRLVRRSKVSRLMESLMMRKMVRRRMKTPRQGTWFNQWGRLKFLKLEVLMWSQGMKKMILKGRKKLMMTKSCRCYHHPHTLRGREMKTRMMMVRMMMMMLLSIRRSHRRSTFSSCSIPG